MKVLRTTNDEVRTTMKKKEMLNDVKNKEANVK